MIHNKFIRLIKIFLILMFVILLSGFGTYATSYRCNASIVTYTPPNSNSEIRLNDALDFLNSSLKAKNLLPSDIGRVVTGFNPVGGGSWQLLYSTTENVYLIRTEKTVEPIANSNKLSVAMSSSNNPSVYNYYSESSVQYYRAFNEGWLSKWEAAEPPGNGSGRTYECTRATAFMLDSGVWNPMYGVQWLSDWSIGGPTIEMVAKVVDCVKGTVTRFNGLSCDWYGYSLGNLSNLNSLSSVPVLSNVSCWYASPANSSDGKCVLCGDKDNKKVTNGSSSAYPGFRPVVCLNKNVTFRRSGSELVINL